MADVQLDDFRDGRDWLHVVVVEPVARVDGQAYPRAETRGLGNPHQLDRLPLVGRIGIGSGVQFDDRRACRERCLELRRLRVHEQRDTDAGFAQRCAAVAQTVELPGDVESTLSGELGAFLRDEAAILRAHVACHSQHRVGGCHLQVHARLQGRAHAGDVVVLDVPPILAQVQRYAVGARLLRDERGKQGIRERRATYLPQRGDVVDVDAEAQWVGEHDSTSGRAAAVGAHRNQHLAGAQRATVETLVERRPEQSACIGEAALVPEFLTRQR